MQRERIAIYHHLGLGDCIECNGMVRHFAEEYKEVNVFAKERYYASCAFMYRDNERIKVHQVPNDNEILGVAEFLKGYEGDFLKPGHEFYFSNLEHFNRLGYSCAEAFYAIAGVPWDFRNEKFFFERDLEEEDRTHDRLNPDGDEYIFVHDDWSRGLKIEPERDVKVIRNSPTESFFGMIGVIKNAKEIHCISSSFLCLIDCMYPETEFAEKFLYNIGGSARGVVNLGENSLKASWNRMI